MSITTLSCTAGVDSIPGAGVSSISGPRSVGPRTISAPSRGSTPNFSGSSKPDGSANTIRVLRPSNASGSSRRLTAKKSSNTGQTGPNGSGSMVLPSTTPTAIPFDPTAPRLSSREIRLISRRWEVWRFLSVSSEREKFRKLHFERYLRLIRAAISPRAIERNKYDNPYINSGVFEDLFQSALGMSRARKRRLANAIHRKSH